MVAVSIVQHHARLAKAHTLMLGGENLGWLKGKEDEKADHLSLAVTILSTTELSDVRNEHNSGSLWYCHLNVCVLVTVFVAKCQIVCWKLKFRPKKIDYVFSVKA